MEKDVHQLLKESGYLASPANRFFWKNATPSLRTHLRQYILASGSAGVPLALMIAWLSRLQGGDAVILFGFYFFLFMAGLALLELFLGLLARMAFLERFWTENKMLNLLPAPIAALALLLIGQALFPVISAQPPVARAASWTGLALCAWLTGSVTHLLLLSRLYWHGIRPPRLHRYPLLTIAALLLVLSLQLIRTGSPGLKLGVPEKRPPVVILAMDLPPRQLDRYAAMFPNWPAQHLETVESDITNFWTEVATGAPASRHHASLVVFKTPLFASSLNQQDPTQRLPLLLFQGLGAAEAATGGGRYRKYFWEILDDYRLRAYVLGFWHTYPASSENGGVLSERWQPANSNDQTNPTRMGLPHLEPDDPLELEIPETLRPSLDRENQIWAQLLNRANRADFELLLAYLPLADLLNSGENEKQEAQERELQNWRSEQLQRLFKRLPAETRFLTLLSSGMPKTEENRIRLRIISNWLPEICEPFQNHMQLAPTLLVDYHIPADRLMENARHKLPLDISAERLDYGEPVKNLKPHPSADINYYEELKSLGYVK